MEVARPRPGASLRVCPISANRGATRGSSRHACAEGSAGAGRAGRAGKPARRVPTVISRWKGTSTAASGRCAHERRTQPGARRSRGSRAWSVQLSVSRWVVGLAKAQLLRSVPEGQRQRFAPVRRAAEDGIDWVETGGTGWADALREGPGGAAESAPCSPSYHGWAAWQRRLIRVMPWPSSANTDHAVALRGPGGQRGVATTRGGGAECRRVYSGDLIGWQWRSPWRWQAVAPAARMSRRWKTGARPWIADRMAPAARRMAAPNACALPATRARPALRVPVGTEPTNTGRAFQAPIVTPSAADRTRPATPAERPPSASARRATKARRATPARRASSSGRRRAAAAWTIRARRTRAPAPTRWPAPASRRARGPRG